MLEKFGIIKASSTLVLVGDDDIPKSGVYIVQHIVFRWLKLGYFNFSAKNILVNSPVNCVTPRDALSFTLDLELSMI